MTLASAALAADTLRDVASRGRPPIAETRELERRVRDGEGLTTGEVAKLLGKHRNTVTRWVDRGQTPTGAPFRHHDGTPLRCHAADVVAVLDASREVRQGREPRRARGA